MTQKQKDDFIFMLDENLFQPSLRLSSKMDCSDIGCDRCLFWSQGDGLCGLFHENEPIITEQEWQELKNLRPDIFM